LIIQTYEVFPTDIDEGLIQIIKSKSIQELIDEKKTIRDYLKNEQVKLENYFKSLGKV
jgi:hypothetical protein